ncbi:magnesium transporter MRS2-1-like [Bidens hawaiensis]|uniref:magnesium transporter MRS2-1-like n=1 Tax=Bidens hawaiensis TaxID=980011 RepID=UPI00404A0C69
MKDLKERFLPSKPTPVINRRDVLGLKKRGQGLRSWISVDAATGESQVIEVDKLTMMRRCDLPARDLRLLDPLFVYPSTILGREKAIVVNLEQIRCIIEEYVVELQRRLKPAGDGDSWQSESSDCDRSKGGRRFEGVFECTLPDYLPFEFKALEVALEVACTSLDTQVIMAAELEIEAYPLLDELTSKISTSNLEHVRRLKSRLVALTRKVQKVI